VAPLFECNLIIAPHRLHWVGAGHAIGSLVAEHIYDLLKLNDSPEALRARYYAALECLTAAQWRDGGGR
jgi:hypothetical protein